MKLFPAPFLVSNIMEPVFKKVYIILHTNSDGSTTDMGEANDLDALQKLYDTLNENIVISIIDSLKRGDTTPFIPKLKLRIRYCGKSGIYLPTPPSEPAMNLTNTHDDFFRYFEKYRRSLYRDRALHLEMTNLLLAAIREVPAVRDKIRSDEHNWFKEQVATSKANGTPVIVRSFPKFKSHEYLEKLLKDSENALQVLVAASDKS